MCLRLICLIFCGLFLRYFFLALSDLSQSFNSVCLFLSPNGTHQEIYQALACGLRLNEHENKDSILRLGLIHIFVASGMHLVFFAKGLRLILPRSTPTWLVPLLLFGFVMTCEFQLPIVRAWLSQVLLYFSQWLSIPSPLRLWLSVFICLIIFPESYFSLSLPLSWCACLAIRMGKNLFWQSLLCYFILLPLIGHFTWLSPWTLLTNLLVSPILAQLLFPLSLISLVVPGLSLGVDMLWSFVFTLFRFVEPLFTLGTRETLKWPLWVCWLYPTVLNLGLIYSRQRSLSCRSS